MKYPLLKEIYAEASSKKELLCPLPEGGFWNGMLYWKPGRNPLERGQIGPCMRLLATYIDPLSPSPGSGQFI